MTREDIEVYIDHFNNKRFDAVIDYFADDVEVYYFDNWTTAPQEHKVLRGREAFKANYLALNENFDEKMRLGVFFANEESLFVELFTEFRAKRDTDSHRAGPMKKGDLLYVNHFVNYKLDENGKFKTIRIAQYNTLDPKDAVLLKDS
jgi:hypothetical protein